MQVQANVPIKKLFQGDKIFLGGILNDLAWGAKSGSSSQSLFDSGATVKKITVISNCKKQALKPATSDLQSVGLNLSSNEGKIAQVLIGKPTLAKQVAVKMINCASDGGYALTPFYLEGL